MGQLLRAIEDGVFRRYISTRVEQAIKNLLTNQSDISSAEDLPADRLKKIILIEFGNKYIYLGDPPIERTLTHGPRPPPSVVELFLATSVIYHAINSEYFRTATLRRRGADRLALSPRWWLKCYWS